MVEKVDWFIKKSPFADRYHDLPPLGGEWNGYIIVPRSNPCFGKHDDELEVHIHGGFTFGACAAEVDWAEIPENYRNEDHWIYGWDTQHLYDTPAKWPKEKVERETARAALEIQLFGIFKEREINTSKRK